MTTDFDRFLGSFNDPTADPKACFRKPELDLRRRLLARDGGWRLTSDECPPISEVLVILGMEPGWPEFDVVYREPSRAWVSILGPRVWYESTIYAWRRIGGCEKLRAEAADKRDGNG